MLRVFDYGIVALRLSQPFAGSWTDLAATAQAMVENTSSAAPSRPAGAWQVDWANR